MSTLTKLTDVLGGLTPIQNCITDSYITLLASDDIYIYHNPLNFDDLPSAVQAIFTKWVPGRIRLEEKRMYIFENIYISWHGVIFKNFNLFVPSLMSPEFSNWFKGRFLLRQWLGKRQALPKKKVIGLVFDQWSAVNYYHWIVEVIPRLIVMERSNEKITLMLPRKLPNYVLETVKIFGFFDYIAIEDNVVYSAKKLLWQERTGTHWLQNVGLLKEARSRIIKAYSIDTNTSKRRTYVSRAKAKIRRLLNEEELQSILINNGFDVVYFENMNFSEQVKIAVESDIVIGVHGANLANLLFMQPGASVIELVNEKSINLCYFRLASYCDVKYYCQPCQYIGEATSNDSDLIVDIDSFSKLLKQVLASKST